MAEVTYQSLKSKLFQVLSKSLDEMDEKEPNTALLSAVRQCLKDFGDSPIDDIPHRGKAKGLVKEYEERKDPVPTTDSALPF